MESQDGSDRIEGDDEDRKKRKREKSSRKRRDRSPKGRRRRDDDESDSDSYDREERRSRKRKSRDDESSVSSEEESDEDSRSRKHKSSKKKRRKNDDKKRKNKKSSKQEKKNKKKKKGRRDDYDKKRARRLDDEDDDDGSKVKKFERNHALAEALRRLLVDHPTPDMAKDTLPFLFLKLGGGASVDLRQMTDRSAKEGIHRVFATLQSFGVHEEGPEVWKWTVPKGNKDEELLLRIVRTLLKEIDFTMLDEVAEAAEMPVRDEAATVDESEFEKIKTKTIKMLQSFQRRTKDLSTSTLPGELGGLCKMLLEGEIVALDGLPDADLREALEELFQQCGLELQEMEGESDGENNAEQGSDKHTMGFAVPESSEQEPLVQAKLLSVMKACETVASAPPVTARKGPMPMPAGYQAPEESSDEEGPLPVGVDKRNEPPPVPKEVIQHQAEVRARQLRGAVSGQPELLSADPTTREEWMLVPGKFDFLSNIKAGNPMKSRTFNAMSKGDGEGERSSRVMNPKIRAELDAIMQAHAESRGPTLVEQHRLKKKNEREEKAAAGDTGRWNWSRDKDLDSGRRVDKNALAMIMGGATKDLKTKFQGGF